jgi:hypothetical protein
VDAYYFAFWPMAGSGIHSVEEWGKAMVNGTKLEGITPLQVADKLDEYAAGALAVLPELRGQAGDNLELEETLNDIEAMAFLGRYYADKMRGAAKLAAFRTTTRQRQFADDAVSHFEDALEEWKTYTGLVSSQYKPQLMQRTHYMDWEAIQEGVEQEVIDAKKERDCPDVRFINLQNGDQVEAGSRMQVEVEAIDTDGIRKVKLYLNGLLLKPETEDATVWSASNEELLKDMKPGIYYLEAVAVDGTGSVGRNKIRVGVGEHSEHREPDLDNDIFQVILNEGDHFLDSEIREFPRLECHLALREDGRLVLYHGDPCDRKGMVWKSMMHSDEGDAHYSTLKEGRLVTYRGKPGQEEAIPYMTHPVSGPGPYQLGITPSKRLVIFREGTGSDNQIVWRSEILEPWRL